MNFDHLCKFESVSSFYLSKNQISMKRNWQKHENKSFTLKCDYKFFIIQMPNCDEIPIT